MEYGDGGWLGEEEVEMVFWWLMGRERAKS